MESSPAGLLGHLSDEVQPRRESRGRGRLCAPPRRLLSPTRMFARCHFRPTATTQSLWELLSYDSHILLVTRRLYTQGRTPLATLLLRFVDSVARYSHADWKREQHAEPT